MSEPFAPAGRTEPLDPPTTLGAPTMPDASDTLSPFFPVLILALVLLGWFAFQAVQLRAERTVIGEAMANQDRQVEESRKLRDSFYAIFHGAEVLGDGGNANAKLVIDNLKKRGINVTPTPPNGAGGPAK